MPTPGEKKALLFLSLIAVLGAGTRLVSANQLPAPTEEELRALDGQLRAVDSASRQAGSRTGRRKAKSAGKLRLASDRDTARGSAGGRVRRQPAPGAATPPPGPPHQLRVDVDRASAAELEALPGIGPALARRIVVTRDSSGPFGSLEELQARVRGVGPALAKRLAPAVTFSAPHSPPSAERTEPFGNGATPAQSKRRRRH